jgi:hydroxyacylglutathione hydrolase
MKYEATPIRVLSDNYAWALGAAGSRQVLVVDPGDHRPLQVWLARHGLELAAVLLTHHHGDHTAGVAALLTGRAIPVYGPAAEPIATVTQPVADGDTVRAGAVELRVLEVPGHTAGHIAYAAEGLVLTGDTLFAGGCGRLFEGTPAQMHASLGRLASLAPETRLCCGHEYTLANLCFAEAVEPGNQALAARLAEVREQRKQHLPTLPSPIGLELATNPFLRSLEASVVAAASRHAGRDLEPGVETFAELRKWKDGWRG